MRAVLNALSMLVHLVFITPYVVGTIIIIIIIIPIVQMWKVRYTEVKKLTHSCTLSSKWWRLDSNSSNLTGNLNTYATSLKLNVR